jgi:hypothetical protein
MLAWAAAVIEQTYLYDIVKLIKQAERNNATTNGTPLHLKNFTDTYDFLNGLRCTFPAGEAIRAGCCSFISFCWVQRR